MPFHAFLALVKSFMIVYTINRSPSYFFPPFLPYGSSHRFHWLHYRRVPRRRPQCLRVRTHSDHDLIPPFSMTQLKIKETKSDCIVLGSIAHSIFTALAYTVFPLWASVLLSLLLISIVAYTPRGN